MHSVVSENDFLTSAASEMEDNLNKKKDDITGVFYLPADQNHDTDLITLVQSRTEPYETYSSVH